jgi:sulfur carrier protein
MTLTVTVNGRPREVDPGTTVAAVVASMAPAAQGVAVAVNDSVVPRPDWTSTLLTEADRVEILTAVQGG